MNKQPIICNRALPLDFATGDLPKRIHIVPRGELFNKEAGVTQVFDDKSIDAILADLQDHKAKNGGLYLGEEHFIYNSEMSSEAFAWAKEFEKDAKGIWAINPDYTDVGEPAIKNKRFKWTSLVADAATPGAVENLGKGRVRILKLDTVGFTNYANGKHLLDPITNRNTFPGADASGAYQTKTERTNTMKSIAQKLGLAPEASEDAILGEVTKLQNRLTTLEPLEAENTTLKNRVAATEGEQYETLLDACGLKKDDVRRARLVPALKTLKNREERLAYLADFELKPVEAKKDTAAQTRVLNRGAGNGGQQVTAASGATITPAQLNAEVRKLMNRDGIKDFTTGFNALLAEKPELFAAPQAA